MLVVCPHCKNMANAKDELVGKQVRCAKCKQLFAAQPAGGTSAGEEGGRTWNTRLLLERSAAIALALVVHLLIVGVLAWLASRPPRSEGSGTEVAIGELPNEQLTENDEGSLAADAANGDSEPADELTLPVNITLNSDAADAIPIDVQMVPSGGANSGEGGVGLDAFAPGGQGSGLGGGASFMGTDARGSRFCIIADYSGSMFGPKLEFAKTEVLRTIRELRGGAKFFVIFFDDRAEAMPGGAWLTGRDFEKVTPWIRRSDGGGGTDPLPAFQIAFNLNPRPDVIFFMTDGVFDANAVPAIAQLNQPRTGKKTTIHTIAFVDRSGEMLMKTIAEQSGGKYRYVQGISP